jgi:predicted small lipoprotein YifL
MLTKLRKFCPLLAVIAMTSCGRNSGPSNLPPSKIHGDPIEPTAVAEHAPLPAEETNGLPKRKHPKPASTQRRMVMAEFVQLTQTNDWTGPMPSGTKGSAADLAKTNLPSVSSIAGLAREVPGYADVTFERLAGFDFVLTKEMADGTGSPKDIYSRAKAQIPAEILAFDGEKVVIEGFLLPVKMKDSLAVEFLLMRNQSMCCYGVPPKVNEWISVQVSGRGVKPIMDQPIAVAGVLHVGPIEENGCLAGIYRLDADKVIGQE